jgi:hypothetical protein
MSGERGPPPSPSFGPHGTGSTGFWMRSGMKKFRRKCWKGKQRAYSVANFEALPDKSGDAKILRNETGRNFV